MPQVSIIVPVFNKEKYVHYCIDSLLNQTFTDFELICIDDGSTDESGKILDEIQISDSRMRVYHTQNQGLSAARNLGLKYACGKYIVFIDSDDFIVPNYLEILYNEAEESQVDLVICRRKTVPCFNPVSAIPLPTIKRYYSGVMEKFLDKEIKISVEAFAKLFRKELLPEITFTHGIYFEDYEFIHTRFFKYVKTLSVVEAEMYFIVQSEQSIMRSPFNIRKLQSWFTILENVCKETTSFPSPFRKKILYKVHNKALHKLVAGINQENSPQKEQLLNEFHKSLRYGLKTGIIKTKYLKNRYRFLSYIIMLFPSKFFNQVVNFMKR